MANPEWLCLFDTGERDHVVGLILSKDNMIRHSLPVTLVPLIDAYCEDNRKDSMTIDIEAAKSFRAAVFDVCRQMDPGERDRFWSTLTADERRIAYREDAAFFAHSKGIVIGIDWERCAEQLKVAWTDFIAAGAGYLQYSEKPKQREARSHGAIKRGERKREIINQAIALFDPGPKSGSKSHRDRIILKRAKEDDYKHFDDLPKSLRKYL